MHHITQANRPIFSDIFRRFYLRDQSDIGVIYFFRVCLVGGKIGRMEKKKKRRENCWERCLVGRERGREFWWGPGVFSSGPPKHYLPKLERKLCKTFWTKMAIQVHCVCIVHVPALPLFPIPLKKKKKNLTRHGRGLCLIASNCNTVAFFFLLFISNLLKKKKKN